MTLACTSECQLLERRRDLLRAAKRDQLMRRAMTEQERDHRLVCPRLRKLGQQSLALRRQRPDPHAVPEPSPIPGSRQPVSPESHG
jgi:hypothetical protein